MKRWGLAFLTAILITGLCGVAGAGQRPKIMIKIATLAPRGSEIMQIISEMNAEIRKKTNNDVGFLIYYGGVQGDEKDVLLKIRMGQLSGGMFTGHGLGQIVPQVRVMELPYLFQNEDEVDYVRSHLYPTMDHLFEEKGFVVIGWNEVGFIYNFSKVPITSIKVAREQKWWVWEGDPLGRAVFKAFGITPVPLSFTDVMTSLSTKLVDSASTTPYGAVAFQWYTRFNYMSEYPTTNVVGATIVTKRVWDRISVADQEKIRAICPAYFKRLNQLARRQNIESIEVLKKSGIKIVPFKANEQDLAFIFKAAKEARESLVGELYSQKLLDRTLNLLKSYRTAHPDSHITMIH